MNKYELACLVAQDTGKPLVEIVPVVNALIKRMIMTILDNEEININKLGSLYLSPKPQRTGYNPYNRTFFVIPQTMTIKYKPAPWLHNQVQERYSQKIKVEKEVAVTEP